MKTKRFSCTENLLIFCVFVALLLIPQFTTALPPVLVVSNGTFAMNTSGLVGYWRFEQSNGSAATNDSSGFGNTGTLTNMNLTGNATSGLTTNGRFGNALQFDGANDYVNLGDKPEFNFSTNDFSISFWINMGQNTTPSGANLYQYPIYKGGDSTTNSGYGFYTREVTASRVLYFAVSNSNGVNYSTKSTTLEFPRDSWHYVVGVRDRTGVLGTANRMYIFLDGVPQGSPADISDKAYLNTSVPLRISGSGGANANFNGTLDEVQIWNRSLSADEIWMLYNNQMSYGQFTNYANSTNTSLSINAYSNQTLLGSGGVWNGTLGTGNQYLLINTTGDSLYNSTEFMLPLNITPGVVTANLYINGTQADTNWVYGQPTNATINVSWDRLNGEGAVSLLRNNTPVGTSIIANFRYEDLMLLGAGLYNYTLNGTGFQNYTFNSNVTYNLAIAKAKPVLIISNETASINTSGLVGYWRFDDNKTDSSGYGGTIQNYSGAYTTTKGLLGNGMEFDGYNDYASAGTNDRLDPPVAGTVSFWMYPKNISEQVMVAKPVWDNPPNSKGYLFYEPPSGNSLTFRVADGAGATCVTPAYTFTINNWYHIVGTWNGTRASLYSNGRLIGGVSCVGHIIASGVSTTIGAYNPNTYRFNGTIDEVMVWNRSLTADEVQMLYQSTATYGTQTNFTNRSSIPAPDILALNFYRNQTIRPNDDNLTLGAGYYYYLLNTTGNANYTAQEFMLPLNITPGVVTANLYINGTQADTNWVYGQPTNATINVSWARLNGEGAVSLLRNNTPVGTAIIANFRIEELALLGAGLYNYTLNGTGFQNYTFNANVTYNLAIAKATPTLIVHNNTASINTSGLVGYWRFEQTNGSAATNDSSGYGNTGTLTNMNLTGNETSGITTNGRFGNALQLDGVNDKVSFGDKTAFNFSNNDFSIAFWIKMGQNTTRISGSGPYQYPIYKGGDGNNAPGYSFYTVESSSRNLFFSISDGNGVNYSFKGTSAAFPRDSWHHVVGVRDRTGVLGTANRMYIFLDGVPQGSPADISDKQWLNTSTALAISGSSVNQMINGTIDEVMIWNRSLTADEVQMLYQSTATYGTNTLMLQMPNKGITNADSNLNTYTYRNQTIIQNDTGLVGYWRFENGSTYGNLTYDDSGYGNTGTLANMNTTGNAASGWNDTCRFGKCLVFDGVNDYVNISGSDSDSSSLNITSAITLSAWVYHSSANFGSYPVIIAKRNITKGVGSYSLRGILNPAWGLEFYTYGLSNLNLFTGSNVVSAGAWHHVAGTWNGTHKSIYVNGILMNITSATGYILPSSMQVTIGADQGVTRAWTGTIDEVRIYNRSLSSDEIVELYNQTRPAGYEYYLVNTTGNANYTSQEFMLPLNITQATLSGNLYINGTQASQTWTYPNATNATATTGTRINNEGTLYLFRNGTDIGILNGANFAMNETMLGASIYNFTTAWVGQNYTFTNITYTLTINKATPNIIIYLNGSYAQANQTNFTYLNATIVNGTVMRFLGNFNASLFRNNTLVTDMINENLTLGASFWNYTAWWAGDENYTANQTQLNLTMLKGLLSFNLYLNNTQYWNNYTYGEPTNATGTIDSRINNEGAWSLLRNGTPVGTATGNNYIENSLLLAAGIYNYSLNVSGFANYTISDILSGRILTIAKSTPILALSQNNTFPTGSGLVGYWSFDENSSTIAYDQSGYGNDGTLNGSIRNTTGKYGNAVFFSGDGSWINITDTPRLDSQYVTVEAWIKTDKSGSQVILSKGDKGTTANNNYLLWISGGAKATFSVGDGAGNINTAIGATTLSVNTWYHLAGVANSTNITIFVNSARDGSTARTINSLINAGQPVIGRQSPPDSTTYFKGLIDEVRVYNYSMTQAEIQASMNATIYDLPITYPNATNVTGFIRLGDNSTSLGLYRNGTQAGGGHSVVSENMTLLAAGIYAYNLTYPETQNYTAKNLTRILSVPQGTVALNLYINGTQASQTYKYPNATNITGTTSSRYNNEGTLVLLRNGTSVGIMIGNDRIQNESLLSASIYNFSLNFTASNYTPTAILSGRDLTMQKGDLNVIIYLNNSYAQANNTNLTYPNATIVNATAVLFLGNKNATLFRNLTLISSAQNENLTLPAGFWNYTAFYSDENYTLNSTQLNLTILKGSLTFNLYLNGTEGSVTRTYPNATNATGTITPRINSEGSFTLLRNGTPVGILIGNDRIENSLMLTSGIYNYSLNASGFVNYTITDILSGRDLTIEKGTSPLLVGFNASSGIPYGEPLLVYANITPGYGDQSATMTIYNNGTQVKQGSGNQTYSYLPAAGIYNFSAYYSESQNYSNSTSIDNNFVVQRSTPILALSQNNSFPSASGLVGYWSFDENATATAYDSSGFNNDGTLTSMGTGISATSGHNTTNCKFGNCLVFDGVNDYVDVKNDASLNASQMTVAMWLNLKSYSHQAVNYQISKMNTANSWGWVFGVLGSWTGSVCGNVDGRVYVSNATVDTGTRVCSSTTLSTDTWYHLAFTYNNSHISLYVNGAFENISLQPIVNSVGNLQIGRRNDGSYNINGTIDEVRIYNYSMTQAEIQASMNATINDLPITYPNATNVTGFVRLGDNSTSLRLERNGTHVGGGHSVVSENLTLLAAGIHAYNLTYPETQNYTAKNLTRILTIPQGSLTTNLYINNSESSQTYWYPNATNATATISARYNNEGAFSLLRNGTPAGTAVGNNLIQDLMLLGRGLYNYSLNVTGIYNYTVSNVTNDRYVTINYGVVTLNLYLNGTEGDANYIYPNATNATGTESATYNNEGLIRLLRNGTDIGTRTGANYIEEDIILASGIWNYSLIFNTTSQGNYTNTSILSGRVLTLDKAAPTMTLYLNGSAWSSDASRTYPNATLVNATVTNRFVDFSNIQINGTLFRNLTTNTYFENTTGIEGILLGEGIWNYTGYWTGDQNNSAISVTKYLTMNKGSLSFNLYLNGSESSMTKTYPNATNATAMMSMRLNNEGAFSLLRNGTPVGTSVSSNWTEENILLASGIWNYSANASGFANYTITDILSGRDLTIPKGDTYITLVLNNSDIASRDYNRSEIINITAMAGNTFLPFETKTLNLTINFTQSYSWNYSAQSITVASGNRSISNITTYDTPGAYNVTAWFDSDQNYSSSYRSKDMIIYGNLFVNLVMPTQTTYNDSQNVSMNVTVGDYLRGDYPISLNVTANMTSTYTYDFANPPYYSANVNLSVYGVSDAGNWSTRFNPYNLTDLHAGNWSLNITASRDFYRTGRNYTTITINRKVLANMTGLQKNATENMTINRVIQINGSLTRLGNVPINGTFDLNIKRLNLGNIGLIVSDASTINYYEGFYNKTLVEEGYNVTIIDDNDVNSGAWTPSIYDLIFWGEASYDNVWLQYIDDNIYVQIAAGKPVVMTYYGMIKGAIDLNLSTAWGGLFARDAYTIAHSITDNYTHVNVSNVQDSVYNSLYLHSFKGTELGNDNTAGRTIIGVNTTLGGRVAVFGLYRADQWTPEAKDMFLRSVYWALTGSEQTVDRMQSNITVAYTLEEYFDESEGNATGFDVLNGTWSIRSGEYNQTDQAVAWHKSLTRHSITDAAIDAKVKVVSYGVNSSAGVLLRWSGANSGYACSLTNGTLGTKVVQLEKLGASLLNYTVFAWTDSTYYTLKLEAKGSSVKCYVDDTLKTEASDTSYSTGTAGLFSYGAVATFDNMRVFAHNGQYGYGKYYFKRNWYSGLNAPGQYRATATFDYWNETGNRTVLEKTLDFNISSATNASINVSLNKYQYSFKESVAIAGALNATGNTQATGNFSIEVWNNTHLITMIQNATRTISPSSNYSISEAWNVWFNRSANYSVLVNYTWTGGSVRERANFTVVYNVSADINVSVDHLKYNYSQVVTVNTSIWNKVEASMTGVRIDCSATDSNGALVASAFTSPALTNATLGTIVANANASNTTTWNVTNRAYGAYTVRCNVTEASGFIDFDAKSFSITSTNATLAIQANKTGNYTVNDAIGVIGNVSALGGLNVSGVLTIEVYNASARIQQLYNGSVTTSGQSLFNITAQNFAFKTYYNVSGAYTLNATFTYTDDAQQTVTKASNTTFNISYVNNVSVSASADKTTYINTETATITSTVTNIGSDNIVNGNLTIRIYNSSTQTDSTLRFWNSSLYNISTSSSATRTDALSISGWSTGTHYVTANFSFGTTYVNATATFAITSVTSSSNFTVRFLAGDHNYTIFTAQSGTLASSRANNSEYQVRWIVSYFNDSALGFYGTGGGVSVTAANSSTGHSVAVNALIRDSKLYAIFTKGDRTNVADRALLLDSGKFNQEINPTFGFPLSDKNTLSLKLKYTDIDIQGAGTMQKGTYKLRVENNGTVNGKTAIAVSIMP